MYISVLLAACCVFRFSRCETVLLVPSGSVTVCPNVRPTLVCRTTGGPLFWETTLVAGAVGKLIDGTTTNSLSLGIFNLNVLDVRMEGSTTVEVNSSATTLIGLRPEDDNTTLSCFLATNFIRNEVTLKFAGAPLAPYVNSISMQSISTSISSILISWSMCDCAVQYVVTINSSDGSVYPNITTSDTNTTVTLPNGVEYCVTVAAVDGIGRRGQDSAPSCYAIPDTPTPSSTIVVEVPTSKNQPLYPVSPSSLLVEHTSTIVTETLSPTQSPVVMGRISLIAVVLPIVITLILSVVLVMVVIVTAVLLFRRQRDSINLEDKPQSPTGVSMSALSHSEQDKLNSVNNVYGELPEFSATMSDHSFTGSRNPSAANIIPQASVTTTSHSGSIDPDQESRSPTLEVATASQERSVPNPPPSSIKCVCQVFHQQFDGLNNWKILIAIFQKEHHIAVVSDMEKYGEAQIFALDPNKNDDLLIDVSEISEGWNFQHELLTVNRTAVEQCNGDGVPPHCEMIFKAAADDVTPSDLSFTSSFEGLQDPLEISIEAQTVTDCIAQVFYYPLNKTSINSWKAKVAFFPKKLKKYVETKIFQDSNVSSHESRSGSLTFSGGKISISAKDTTGWNVTMCEEHKEVDTALMEQYNGIGEPPYCEMLLELKTISTPTDLELPVTLIGVKSPNNSVTLKRAVVVTSERPHTPPVSSKV